MNLQIGGPTSYYVRFTPRNEQEIHALESEFNIEVFEEPLDSDFLDETYVEPPLPSSESAHFYTTVDIDSPFDNGIAYEILYEAYLPLEDDLLVEQFLDDRNPGGSVNNDGVINFDDDYPCELLVYSSELENESLSSSGYGHLVEPYNCEVIGGGGTGGTGGTGSGSNTYSSNFYGRITADDDHLGVVPI